MSDHLLVKTSEAGDCSIVECHGELDIASAPEVEAVVRDLLDEGVSRLRLDWSGLTFMDSTGIRLLLEILVLCRDQKVPLTWDLGPNAQRALDAVGIHDDILRDYASRGGNDRPPGRPTLPGPPEDP
jgi:anti-anti-sigma factor